MSSALNKIMGSMEKGKKMDELSPLFTKIVEDRVQAASSIMEFNFEKTRLRYLTKVEEVKAGSNGILYWMSREFRVQDNWSMLFAQKLALENKMPLYVVSFLLPKFLDANIRQYKYFLKGLQEVAFELQELNISFNLIPGWPYDILPKLVSSAKIGAVVCDFHPLREPMQWIDEVNSKLPGNIPLIQVDGHNIIPCWITSNVKEYAARNIRPKIYSKLDTYLTPFPPVIKHPYYGTIIATKMNWEILLYTCDIDTSVSVIQTINSGYKGGIRMLESFCKKRLKKYSTKRNDPCENALSNLSPWLHFGQISAQRCVLEVKRYKQDQQENVDAYLEEILIHRELSDNFCFYNPNYDNFNGVTDWGKATLNKHRNDTRPYIYTRKDFEEASTHDILWNAAQLELLTEGKMHSFMRIYWAKKILEWTESPEDALKIAIYLNDRYSLDGCDPNGYAGIMYAICGIHDSSWAEKPVFGRILYIRREDYEKRFKVMDYIVRWCRSIDTVTID